MRRLILCLAALLLFLSPALGEEEIIAPAYPVPQYVEWLLDVARGEIGYTEGRDLYTKYGEWAGDPYAEWCAEFLCWCVDQVDQQHGTRLLTQVYPRYSGMNTGMNWFIAQGRFIARNGVLPDWGSQWFYGEEDRMASASYIPQPGDWVFYTFDASGNTAHVAMVEYCTLDESGGVTAHVIEGNLPDRVQRNAHRLDDWRVLGYGTVRDLAGVVLNSHASGKKVEKLQQMLFSLGYLDERYITGNYGSATAQAVRDFQSDTGKTPTGIANHHTQDTLSQLYWQDYWLDDSHFTVREN
ncbi:MAG: peptidoglycan-binding protein [Clostridia bacterium]|nr:peptidoglycan-binding protein [Clostridia bacterium]